MPIQEYSIAVGFNNAVNLVNLETIIIENRPLIVKGVGNYRQGEVVVQTNGRYAFIGYPSIKWIFDVLSRAQYVYLKDTYCAGSYSGDVTIRTRTDGNSYSNFNAVLTLPFTDDVTKVFRAYTGITATLTRLEAI